MRGPGPSPVGPRVGEAAVRVQAGTHTHEAIPAGVAVAQAGGRLEMALAPVGSAPELVHDRLDRAEVGPPLHAAIHVHRHEPALPPAGRRQEMHRRPPPSSPRSGRGRRSRAAAPSPSRPSPQAPCAPLGRAYSISVKRTRRGLAKIAPELSSRSERPASLVTARFSRGISRGTRLPSPAEELEGVVGEHHLVRICGEPAAWSGAAVGAVVRSASRAVSACGNTKNSKWSFSRASSWKRSRVSSRGLGSSTPCRVNARTHRRVTSAITPRAPRPTRAARNASGSRSAEQSRVEPSASTRVSSLTCAERLGSRAPVPWVAVEIAPAIVWASMSPRFGRASPRSRRRPPSSRIVMPAWTRTRPEGRSTSRRPSIPSRETISPSTRAMSLKECPVPTARTRRPRADAWPTASESSCTDRGRARRAGRQCWSPAQLRHSADVCCGSLGSPIR